MREYNARNSSGSNRCINGVSSLAQDLQAGQGGQVMPR
jgi:hypothetical protein